MSRLLYQVVMLYKKRTLVLTDVRPGCKCAQHPETWPCGTQGTSPLTCGRGRSFPLACGNVCERSPKCNTTLET